jgi:hypothetical protein
MCLKTLDGKFRFPSQPRSRRAADQRFQQPLSLQRTDALQHLNGS